MTKRPGLLVGCASHQDLTLRKLPFESQKLPKTCHFCQKKLQKLYLFPKHHWHFLGKNDNFWILKKGKFLTIFDIQMAIFRRLCFTSRQLIWWNFPMVELWPNTYCCNRSTLLRDGDIIHLIDTVTLALGKLFLKFIYLLAQRKTNIQYYINRQ